jgi:phospholipase C
VYVEDSMYFLTAGDGGGEVNLSLFSVRRSICDRTPLQDPPRLGTSMTQRRALALGIGVIIVAVVVILSGWGMGWFSSGATAATPTGTPIQHVVVIFMENQEVPQITEQSPEFNYLATTYGNASQFYPICHGSEPNLLTMTSGYSYPCGNATIPISANRNLPDLLTKAGDSWGAYFESMPTPCDKANSTSYMVQHNPFLLYSDIADNASRCDSHLLNSDVFNSSLAAGTLPNVSWYVPNRFNDCDYASLPFCSTWLQGFLNSILRSSSPTVQGVVAHTAFIITFDEGTTDLGYTVPGVVNPWCQSQTGTPLATCGGHSYLVVLSPYSMGTTYTHDATDANVESTIEWLFGLPSDGGNDGTANFPSMNSLFSFTSNK